MATRRFLFAALALLLVPPAALAESIPAPADSLFSSLHWRPIGPLRGGRTKAAVGVPGHPGLYFIGAVNGGVWRTDDFGRTWTPLFDAQPTQSIGAIAVDPKNPNLIYVGSGEGLHRPDLSVGDGVYKSVDGGKSWQHLGLRDSQQIPQLALDPTNPDRLFVAALGHPYGPNEERGLYRTLDGGKSFQKVLGAGPDVGAADVVLDPKDPRTVYASLWEAREAPWENGEFVGPGSGLFKSTDGGDHWTRIGRGLPDFASGKLSRIGIGLAPSQPSRIFVTVAAEKGAGLYRSDDGGGSFRKITDDDRVAERGDDFAEVKVDPQNPGVVYTASVVVWKSVDGGRTFSALRGAPGGDDYQRIWIDPQDPRILLIASDQGAIITVNGGRTFSSWYNQPTAQMFHATADNSFPYRVCGGQQDSGSACVASRSGDGAITARDWRPVGIEEYGYAAPDPLDPQVIYGGRVSRFDGRTGQLRDVSPDPLRRPGYRVIRTQPLVFSPRDPHLLYFASNRVWSTRDGGQSWSAISPDLTRATFALPDSIGKFRAETRARQRGVIYALGPSPLVDGLLWAGTDDGLLHVSRDGGRSWINVTPPQLQPWAKVSVVEASHFDANEAFAAINTLRLDDLRPHLLRTRDGGRSWSEITAGLPPGPVNVIREDPVRRGLLFCGTERSVFVSADDGDHWAPLRLDLPQSSVRDLTIKGDDLIAATHGRGFYILDDLSPLRQLGVTPPNAPVALLRPQTALRMRWNTNPDTPPPPDEPRAENPPDGARIDYWLAQPAPVLLEVLDSEGQLVRRLSSADPAPPLRDEGNVPRYWLRPQPPLPSSAGLHRIVWDLRDAPPPSEEPAFPMGAIPGDTPREPRGPWVVPGHYTLQLTAGGRTVTQPLTVVLDPRVKASEAELQAQRALSLRLAAGLRAAVAAHGRARQLRGLIPAQAMQLAALLGGAPDPASAGTPDPAHPPPPTLQRTRAHLAQLYDLSQEADAGPHQTLLREAEHELGELRGELEQLGRLGGAARP